MAQLSDDALVDGLREIISRKGLKMPFLAKELGISYRSLQNYFYKNSRMPIWVYLKLCALTGISPDYLIEGRFKLEYHELLQAVEAALAPVLDGLDVDVTGKVYLRDAAEGHELRRRRVIIGYITQIIRSRYDLEREASLRRNTGDESEGGNG